MITNGGNGTMQDCVMTLTKIVNHEKFIQAIIVRVLYSWYLRAAIYTAILRDRQDLISWFVAREQLLGMPLINVKVIQEDDQSVWSIDYWLQYKSHLFPIGC